jgi:hypothetical protein
MKVLWRRVPAISALAAVSLLVTCGGDKALNLGEYFGRLEDVQQTAEVRANALNEQSVGQDIESSRKYFEGFEAIQRDTLDALNDMHPPAEVRDAHLEYVAALQQALALTVGFSDRLAAATSSSDLETVIAGLSDPSFDAASRRLSSTCLDLQGIATANGIEVDLRCD